MPKSTRSFRPRLEALEDRSVPSSMARQLGWQVEAGLLTLQQALGAGPVRVPSQATIDFSAFDRPHGAGTLQVTLGYLKAVDVGAGKVAREETWVGPLISVTADDTATVVATKVFQALPMSTVDWTGFVHTQGYDVTRDGSRIILKAYNNAKDEPRDVTRPAVATSGDAIPVPTVDFEKARLVSP